MSKNRTLVFIAVGALALAGAAFATLPATAEEEPSFEIDVRIDTTSPRVSGLITVTTTDGAPVVGATIDLVSTHDVLPLPAAETNAATGGSGTATFDYGLISTAAVPGDHTLMVTVTVGDDSQSVTVAYTA